MSNNWTRTALSAMYGYQVDGKQDLPYYRIDADVIGFDKIAYSYLVGAAYSVTFIPFIMFVGYITENVNRKNLVGTVCILWGIFTYV